MPQLRTCSKTLSINKKLVICCYLLFTSSSGLPEALYFLLFCVMVRKGGQPAGREQLKVGGRFLEMVILLQECVWKKPFDILVPFISTWQKGYRKVKLSAFLTPMLKLFHKVTLSDNDVEAIALFLSSSVMFGDYRLPEHFQPF